MGLPRGVVRPLVGRMVRQRPEEGEQPGHECAIAGL